MDDANYVYGDAFDYHPEREEIDLSSPLGRFKQLLEAHPDPNAEIDLAEAALIVASEAYPGLKESAYIDELDRMADEVSVLISGESDPWRIVGNINDYLFNKKGFRGNQTEYNDPRNSYFNEVLDRKTGIPITLSLIYLEIARRLRLPIEGIGLPGHFIVRYHRPSDGQSFGLGRAALPSVQPGLTRLLESEDLDNVVGESTDILIDPFNKGDILTEEDCIRRLQEAYGRNVPVLASFMRPVSDRQFLTRMLSNLKAAYTQQEQPDFERTLQIEQFIIALNPNDWSEVRDRGAIHFRLGHFWAAIHDMRVYLRHVPNASDAAQVQSHIRNIFSEMVVRN